MKDINILFLGDIVGPNATKYVQQNLKNVVKSENIDFVCINGENSAKGNGLDKQGLTALISSGCDCITTGNHVFKNIDTLEFIEDNVSIIRPANFPPDIPGRGYYIYDMFNFRILVINMLGVVNLEPLDSPYNTVDKILEKEKDNYDFSIIDFHAEATSEKYVFAYYVDGRVGAVLGTHTHVPTADEHILPNGTAFITDVGMCGPIESALGVNPECVLKKLKNHVPSKFELSTNPIKANGVIVKLSGENGLAKEIRRYSF